MKKIVILLTLSILFSSFSFAEECEVASVRYTQSTIGSHFRRTGEALKAVVARCKADLERCKDNPEILKSIRVFKIGDDLFSLDNRTLYVAKTAGLEKINCELVSDKDAYEERWKFTNIHDGYVIHIIGKDECSCRAESDTLEAFPEVFHPLLAKFLK